MAVTYPAGVGVEEPPEHAIFKNVLHLPAPVQEDSEHALSQLDNTGIFLCFCWFRGIVGHGMLLGNRRYNKGGMKSDQLSAQ